MVRTLRQLAALSDQLIGVGMMVMRRAVRGPVRSFEALDARFRKVLSDYPHIPGMVATVVRHDEVLWRGAFGVRDLDDRIPMTCDTIMNVASVTKTLTGAVVARLVAAEALKLDDDVSDTMGVSVRNPHHPESPITLRHLLFHRSSIRDSDDYALSYICGDSRVPLGEWLQGYLQQGDSFRLSEGSFGRLFQRGLRADRPSRRTCRW